MELHGNVCTKVYLKTLELEKTMFFIPNAGTYHSSF